MSTEGRNIPLAYLRTFLTLLVVAHHAVLAYHPHGPQAPPASLGESLLWSAFPIVDPARWPGIELLVGFNDTFFMSLMFLVSGVFAWPSLERKGAKRFVRERLTRLGPAFVFSAALLAPLAYYPTFLQMGPQPTSFARQWLSLGVWPAGPAWFLWVLLVLGALAALVHPIARRHGGALGRLGERPLRFLAALVAVSALAYLPLAAAFTPFHWASFGPFFVQTSRILHYAVYFAVGMALGAYGVDAGLLGREGRLARRWPLWTVFSLFAFVLTVVALLVILSTLSKGGPGPVLSTLGNLSFVVSCAASSLAFLALFVRFARRPNPVVDSLDANAFGIYIVHYVWVSWLQWWLLPAALTGAAKGTLVFLGATLASWASSAAFRAWLNRPTRRPQVAAGATRALEGAR